MTYKLFTDILSWSEAGSVVLCLIVLFFKRKQPHFFKPVIIYLVLALIYNGVSDLLDHHNKLDPSTEDNIRNTPVYNLHSASRMICFSLFFIRLDQPGYTKFHKLLLSIFVAFVFIHFTYFEPLVNSRISGDLFAVEAYILLISCLLYYLYEIRTGMILFESRKAFWVVTGLSLYVVINFFVFLFYNVLVVDNVALAVKIWYVHNVAYILLCLFIAKAFYVPHTVSE